jgi:hypothetical protein
MGARLKPGRSRDDSSDLPGAFCILIADMTEGCKNGYRDAFNKRVRNERDIFTGV